MNSWLKKKSPLVLPPDYGELPSPTENYSQKKNDENIEIQVSLGKDSLKIDETIKNTAPTDLEKSVLDKIK